MSPYVHPRMSNWRRILVPDNNTCDCGRPTPPGRIWCSQTCRNLDDPHDHYDHTDGDDD